MPRSQRRSSSGFTLIELLVVIAIIAILAAIILAAMERVGMSRNKVVSTSHIWQVVMSLHIYSQSNGGLLPHQYDADRGLDWSGAFAQEGYVPEALFHAPADDFSRRFEGTPRRVG